MSSGRCKLTKKLFEGEMCFYGINDRYSASILVCSGTTPDTNWACFHPHYWQVASIHTDSDRPKGNETHLVNLKTQQLPWLLKVREDKAQIDGTLTRVWSCFCLSEFQFVLCTFFREFMASFTIYIHVYL